MVTTMKVQIDRNTEEIEAKKVTISLGDTSYEISINKFGGITVQKEEYGLGESNIIIRPCVSNEINLV